MYELSKADMETLIFYIEETIDTAMKDEVLVLSHTTTEIERIKQTLVLYTEEWPEA